MRGPLTAIRRAASITLEMSYMHDDDDGRAGCSTKGAAASSRPTGLRMETNFANAAGSLTSAHESKVEMDTDLANAAGSLTSAHESKVEVAFRPHLRNDMNGAAASCKGPTDSTMAYELSELRTRVEITGSPFFASMKAEISNVSKLRGVESHFECYRGVAAKCFLPGSTPNCGPPPNDKAGHCRYNPKGKAVLYLCDTIDGVFRELAPTKEPKLATAASDASRIWVQRFLVPLSRLNIAGLAELPDDHRLNWVFFYAELSTRSQPCNCDDPGKYLFSQLLAEIVENSFDGMLVRGARGKYRNLVVFEPDGVWQDWSAGEPQLLTSPYIMPSD